MGVPVIIPFELLNVRPGARTALSRPAMRPNTASGVAIVLVYPRAIWCLSFLPQQNSALLFSTITHIPWEFESPADRDVTSLNSSIAQVRSELVPPLSVMYCSPMHCTVELLNSVQVWALSVSTCSGTEPVEADS